MAGIAAAVVRRCWFSSVWSWLVLWRGWNGREPVDSAGVRHGLHRAGFVRALSALALGLTLIAGRFAGFLNLSTLQQFYSARLTRAYLGGSNGQRFAPGSGAAPAQQHASQRARLSVAEARGRRCAQPEHLLRSRHAGAAAPDQRHAQPHRGSRRGNWCSATARAKPLCIAPGPFMLPPAATRAVPADSFVRFTVDGQLYYPETHKAGGSELSQSRTLGDWIATSGAAISTGLGRSTTLGTSLLLGLANLRLGTWWPSYPLDAGSAPRAGGADRDCVQADLCRVALAGRLYHAVPHPVLPGLRG
ncbi:hypothetical protein ACU4GD_30105 [Cupriavidus basilensis]